MKLRKNLNYLKRGFGFVYKGAGIYAGLMIVFRIIYGLAPFLNAWLLNRITNELQDDMFQEAVHSFILLLVLQLFMLLCSVLHQYFNSIYYNKLLIYSYLYIFKNSSRISSEYYETEDNQKEIDLIMNDSIWSPFRIYNVSINVIQALICLTSFILFVKNLVITMVYFVAVIIYMLLMSKQGREEYQLTLDLQDKERELGNITEMFYKSQYAKEIRVYQYGEYMINKWKSIIGSLIKPRLGLMRKNTAQKSGLQILLSLITLVYFVAAGFGIANGVLTIGMISALTVYVADVNYSIELLGDITKTYGKNVKLLKHLFDYVDRIQEIYRSRNLTFNNYFDGDISIRNLNFSYPSSEKMVLKNINLDIKRGEHVAFVGKNGAGKTTLAYLIAGIYQPVEGEILVDGVNIAGINQKELQEHIGMVSQFVHKFQLTLQENILLGKGENHRDMDCLLADMGLDQLVSSFKHGTDELLGKDFGEVDLSGGEWQKLALARCFAYEKDVYLLDEPTSALDPKMEYTLLNTFKKYSAGHTSILISHRLGALRDVDKIFFMEEGEITHAGTHKELMKTCAAYRELYNTQSKWFIEREGVKK